MVANVKFTLAQATVPRDAARAMQLGRDAMRLYEEAGAVDETARVRAWLQAAGNAG